MERWLSYYLPQQLHIIDGEQLRQNPIETLHELQRFLKITPTFNYSTHLRYDPKKGFFCQVTNEDRTKCLGKGKGRQYPPMEERSYKFLQVLYINITSDGCRIFKHREVRFNTGLNSYPWRIVEILLKTAVKQWSVSNVYLRIFRDTTCRTTQHWQNFWSDCRARCRNGWRMIWPTRSIPSERCSNETSVNCRLLMKFFSRSCHCYLKWWKICNYPCTDMRMQTLLFLAAYG